MRRDVPRLYRTTDGHPLPPGTTIEAEGDLQPKPMRTCTGIDDEDGGTSP